MADIVRWISISTNMFDDEKIKLLEQMPDYRALQLIWIKLICHAGKCNSRGYIFLAENIPYTNEQLSILFREPVKTIELSLLTFEKLGMIKLEDGKIWLTHFAEWNGHLLKLENYREKTKNRVKRYRERKALPQAQNSSNVNGNVTVTECNDTTVQYSTSQYITLKDVSYASLKEILLKTENGYRVGVLVTAFKLWHKNTIQEDYDNCGMRLGVMLKQTNDPLFLLSKIWDTASKEITGSHLNYIQGCLKQTTNNKDSKQDYTGGEYGHLIKR